MSIDYTPNNTFIFSFVRMNPPTPGHLVLIKTMIDKAIEIGTEKIYVITSSSMDGKNPIPCSDKTIPEAKNKKEASILSGIISSPDLIYKSNVLNDMITSYKQQLIEEESDPVKKTKIQNLNIIVLCSQGRTFGFIFGVINENFLSQGVSKVNLYFVVGRDRADFLDSIVDFFKDKPGINSVDGDILGRQGMGTLKETGIGDRTIAEINPSEYSASFVRKLVENGKRIEFEQVYSKYLNSDEINNLYETIKLGMNLKPPTGGEDENPPTKYFTEDPSNPGVYIKRGLPIINKTSGGRRKKRKTKRYSKKNYKRKYTRRNKRRH